MIQAQVLTTQHPSVARYLRQHKRPVGGILGEEQLRDLENHVVRGEAIELLSSLPSDCIDLVHTSPPYNIDRPYEMSSSDKNSESEYFNF